jgi:hypothetical protein
MGVPPELNPERGRAKGRERRINDGAAALLLEAELGAKTPNCSIDPAARLRGSLRLGDLSNQ